MRYVDHLIAGLLGGIVQLLVVLVVAPLFGEVGVTGIIVVVFGISSYTIGRVVYHILDIGGK